MVVVTIFFVFFFIHTACYITLHIHLNINKPNEIFKKKKLKNKKGRNLLHIAAAREDLKLTTFLLSRGTRFVCDNDGQTPLDVLQAVVEKSLNTLFDKTQSLTENTIIDDSVREMAALFEQAERRRQKRAVVDVAIGLAGLAEQMPVLQLLLIAEHKLTPLPHPTVTITDATRWKSAQIIHRATTKRNQKTKEKTKTKKNKNNFGK